jgi:ABC-type transport system substrate-binding protein
MISPAAINKYGEKLGQYPAGTGPFKFVEWVPGDRIVLTKNTDFWKGKPRLDGIIFKFTPDMTVRMMGFESLSFDLLDQPQYADIDRLSRSKKYESRFQVSSEMFHFVFNCAGGLFNQKEQRQALAYAVNKELIVKSLLGENVVIAHGFGPTYLTDTLMKKDAYAHDPEKAREILKSLGWKPGSDGIFVKDGKRFQFKILTPVGRYPMDKQIAEALQANVKRVGIDASVETVESAAFIKWIRSPKEEMAASGIGLIVRTRPLGGSLDWAFTQHYHSKYLPPDGNNSGYFSNKDLDDILMKAVSIVDENQRREAYRKAQEILFEDLPAIPIYYYRNFMFTHPYVRNIDLFTPLATPSPFVSHETWIDK